MSLTMLAAYSTAPNSSSLSSSSDIESRLEKLSLNLIQQSIYSSTRGSSINKSHHIHPLHHVLKGHTHHHHHHHHHSFANQKAHSVSNVNSSSAVMPCLDLTDAPTGTTTSSSSGVTLSAANGKSKKVVRFADMLGLQLVTERIISSNPSLFFYNSSDDDENEDLNNAECLLAAALNSTATSETLCSESAMAPMLSTPLNLTFNNTAENAQLHHTSAIQVTCSSASSRSDPNQFIYDNLRFQWKCGFEQPSLAPDFYSQLRHKKVCLESICTDHFILNGFVRVLNTSAHKRIFIRYTLNNWSSSMDYECQYLLNSTQSGQNDRFKFSIILDKNKFFESISQYSHDARSTDSLPSLKLEFCICYEVLESPIPDAATPSASTTAANTVLESHWDNNGGKNYHYDCFFKII
jgi:hypothetical protein